MPILAILRNLQETFLAIAKYLQNIDRGLVLSFCWLAAITTPLCYINTVSSFYTTYFDNSSLQAESVELIGLPDISIDTWLIHRFSPDIVLSRWKSTLKLFLNFLRRVLNDGNRRELSIFISSLLIELIYWYYGETSAFLY